MKLLIRLTIKYLVFAAGTASLLFPAQSNAGNLTNAAKNAGMTFATGAIVNMAFGVKFSKLCAQPSGAAFCAMAALSFAQSALDGSGASESLKVQRETQCTGSFCNPGGPTDSAGDGGLGTVDPGVFDNGTGGTETTSAKELAALQNKISTVTRQAQQGVKDMADKGYVANPKTGEVTGPGGKSADMTTAAGMAAMGMTPSQIEEAMDVYKNTKVSGLARVDGGYGGGGGGGVRVAARGPASNDFDMNAYMRGLQGGARKPASLNGLKKFVGNEAIGVSVDNIFDMVNRRYKSEAEHGKFLP